MRAAKHMEQKLNIKIALTGPEDADVLRVVSRGVRWTSEKLSTRVITGTPTA